MARQAEEELEFVLGNRELLGLFFVIVAFFAAFFSVGYAVGFDHGQSGDPLPTVASTTPQPDQRPKDEIRLPDTLLKEAPKPLPATAPKVSAAAATAPQAELKPTTEMAVAKAAVAVEKPAPKPVAAPKPSPAARPPAQPAADEGYHLQVAALRVRQDADLLAKKLKDKGYPAAVSMKGDGWIRVVVGPFASAEAAQTFKKRLSADGFDTMLRKP
jgi:cell division protein FtsN